MKKFLIFLILSGVFTANAQKVDSIYFNLYTDSLKKGVHNYINVDGKMSDGRFYPLMSSEVDFSSSAGKWNGNSIIIDSAYLCDSVVITAALKANPAITKSVTIFMKRNLFEGELKTEEELLQQWKRGSKRKQFSE